MVQGYVITKKSTLLVKYITTLGQEEIKISSGKENLDGQMDGRTDRLITKGHLQCGVLKIHKFISRLFEAKRKIWKSHCFSYTKSKS